MFPIAPFDCTQQLGYLLWRAFSDEELDRIVAIGDEAEHISARVGGHEKPVEKVRTSKIAWINCNQDTTWLFEKLATIVRKANAENYRFDLSGFIDSLQYTIYDADDGRGGHYDWHIDPHGTGHPLRKLSLSIQLSDSFDYEGGELQVWGAQKQTLNKERGLIHIFPSWMLHRVTPVTSGVRKSLVAWVSGPDWR